MASTTGDLTPEQEAQIQALLAQQKTTDPIAELGEGDFGAVKGALDRSHWGQGVVFNPPTIKKSPGSDTPDQWNRSLFTSRVNAPGFMTIDPIVAAAISATNATTSWSNRTTNYGFRFLFNPTSFTEAYQRNMDGSYLAMLQIISQLSKPPVTPNTGASFAVQLLLARHEDVRLLRNATINQGFLDAHYPRGTVTPEQAKAIAELGTMADIEHLFRMVNSGPYDTWRGKTSDFGMLLPTMCDIFLGDSKGSRKIRGIVNGAAWTHQQFAPGMIPVYTQLTLNITRMPDSYSQAGVDSSDNVGTTQSVGATPSGTTNNSTSGSTPSSGGNNSLVAVPNGGSNYATRTGMDAINWGRQKIGSTEYPGLCLTFVDDSFAPTGGRQPYAIDQWNRANSAGYGHSGDRNPPVGAQVFWWTSDPARHIAIATPDGKTLTTGLPGDVVGEVPLSQLDSWGPYIGWAPPYYG